MRLNFGFYLVNGIHLAISKQKKKIHHKQKIGKFFVTSSQKEKFINIKKKVNEIKCYLLMFFFFKKNVQT